MSWYLFPDVVALHLLQVLPELVLEKHVAFDVGVLKLRVLGADRVVGEVDELIAHLLGVVINRRKPQIRFLVEPYGEGVEVGDEHPLSDVELAPQHHQGVLNVLLGDPKRLLASDVVLDLYQVVVASDPSPSTQPRWFQYPNVVVVRQMVLRKTLFILFQ